MAGCVQRERHIIYIIHYFVTKQKPLDLLFRREFGIIYIYCKCLSLSPSCIPKIYSYSHLDKPLTGFRGVLPHKPTSSHSCTLCFKPLPDCCGGPFCHLTHNACRTRTLLAPRTKSEIICIYVGWLACIFPCVYVCVHAGVTSFN